MTKLKELAKKFGVVSSNGASEQLKEARQRIENIESKAMEVLERMKNSRSVILKNRAEYACGSNKR